MLFELLGHDIVCIRAASRCLFHCESSTDPRWVLLVSLAFHFSSSRSVQLQSRAEVSCGISGVCCSRDRYNAGGLMYLNSAGLPRCGRGSMNRVSVSLKCCLLLAQPTLAQGSPNTVFADKVLCGTADNNRELRMSRAAAQYRPGVG